MRSMLITLCLIVTLTCNSYSFVNGESSNADLKCPNNFTTNAYDYTATFPIEQIKNQNDIFLTFFVKAGRDAIIIFSPEDQPAKRGEKAYEIVIGAEENKSLYIRKQRLGVEVKTHTPGILSNQEWRQFWIRINSQGLIEVGKEEIGSPIMSWKDDKPMRIKHYGFSSWLNYEVTWSLPCFKKNKTAKDLEDALFAPNTTTNAPPKNVSVTFTSQSANVNDQYLDIGGSINITWENANLTWNVTEYNNINRLEVDNTKVWKPEIILQNKTLQVNSANVTISPKGIVQLPFSISKKLSCLPKGNSSMIPLLKCQMTLALAHPGVDIHFTALKDSTSNVESSHVFSELKPVNSNGTYILFYRRT